MKKLIGTISLCSLLAACGGDKVDGDAGSTLAKPTKEALAKRIDSVEAKLQAMQSIDPQLGTVAVKAYSDYANMYPDDSLAADRLFKAAEISSALNKGQEAIRYYESILANYPTYKKTVHCYFLEAFIYENQLRNLEKAKEYYQKVIEKFPGDKLALDAQACIEHLGKSDEELIKMFEEKNRKKS